MPTIDIALTAPQKEFVTSTAPFPAMVAGLGAGKSRASTMRLLYLMIENIQAAGEGINTLYTMPTYDLLRLRAMPGIEEDLTAMGISYKLNKSEYSIFVPALRGSILFRSYDKPERLIAFECAHSIADELDTLPIEKAAFVYRKIVERTRQISFKPNSIGVPTTPDQGVNGFVYKKWVKEAKEGYQLIKASTLSNPYLPDSYVEQIRSMYDPVLAELYINGEFVSLNQNKVYHFFDRVANATDRVIADNDRQLHVSIDFNIGGCAATVTVYDNGMPLTVDEFVSHDTRDFINNLAHRYPDKDITIYPDASGKAERTNATASDIALIAQAGYRVDAPNKNPFVRDRVNSVNGMISHKQWAVNIDKCPELVHALESQGYDKNGDPEKYNTHPAIDDWVDSFGYFLHRLHPIIKPVTKIKFSGF